MRFVWRLIMFSKEIKIRLNRGEFKICEDLNCITQLIKVWYRELPQSVLSVVQPSVFINQCEDEEECLAVYDSLPKVNKYDVV